MLTLLLAVIMYVVFYHEHRHAMLVLSWWSGFRTTLHFRFLIQIVNLHVKNLADFVRHIGQCHLLREYNMVLFCPSIPKLAICVNIGKQNFKNVMMETSAACGNPLNKYFTVLVLSSWLWAGDHVHNWTTIPLIRPLLSGIVVGAIAMHSIVCSIVTAS